MAPLAARVLLYALFISPAVLADTDPAALVDGFHSDLSAMVALPTIQERAAYLEPRVGALFDLERIAMFSVGRTWRDLEDAERGEFIELLHRQMALTYADRFGEGSVPEFEGAQTTALNNGSLVKSAVRSKRGVRVPLDYFMRDGRVFNVAADGVSDLSLRRADYSRIVKDEGFASLLAHLRGQVTELEAQDR